MQFRGSDPAKGIIAVAANTRRFAFCPPPPRWGTRRVKEKGSRQGEPLPVGRGRWALVPAKARIGAVVILTGCFPSPPGNLLPPPNISDFRICGFPYLRKSENAKSGYDRLSSSGPKFHGRSPAWLISASRPALSRRRQTRGSPPRCPGFRICVNPKTRKFGYSRTSSFRPDVSRRSCCLVSASRPAGCCRRISGSPLPLLSEIRGFGFPNIRKSENPKTRKFGYSCSSKSLPRRPPPLPHPIP